MRILLTNHKLDRVGGSESWLIAMRNELLRRGHQVEVWTPNPGSLGRRLKSVASPTGKYDLALCNHGTTINVAREHTALLIQTCHGVVPAVEQWHRAADIHVGVSEEIVQHIANGGHHAHLIRNGIDMDVFDSLEPSQPRAKIVGLLSNYPGAVNIVREACQLAGVQFRRLSGINHVAAAINQCDIIVGLGRSALEAMSCARNVIVFDARRYQRPWGDGYMEGQALNDSMRANYSGRAYHLLMSAEDIASAIARYAPDQGLLLRSHVRRHHDVRTTASDYLRFAGQADD